MSDAKLPRRAHIHEQDLPFAFPPPDAPVWNMHPRIVLQISSKQPEITCPYCGTHYILVSNKPVS